MPTSLESFCSFRSMQGDEPISGTAMTAKQYLFISWPKKFWARNQFDSVGFPQTLVEYLGGLQRDRGIVTKLAYRQGETKKDFSDLLFMPAGLVYENVAIGDIAETLAGYLGGLPDVKYQRSEPGGSFLFLCTHGKRDNCCAKFGQPIISELERVALERQFHLNVWECSHIGADRLAATGVTFPTNFMYGRMRVENIPQIVDSLIDELPYPPCFRGRLGTGALDQVAEAFGHGYAFNNNLKDPEVIIEAMDEMSEQKHGFTILVRNRKSGDKIARFRLIIEKHIFPTYLDCDGLKTDSPKQLPRWVVTGSSRL